MKRLVVAVLMMSFFFSVGNQTGSAAAEQGELRGTITMSGAWALYPMAIKWAEEFQKINPKVRIDISAGGAGKGMADALGGAVDIGNVSREVYPAEIEKGAWWVSVTKDAVVPTINGDNPCLKKLFSQGVTRDAFIGIWITERVKSWRDVVDCEGNFPIHVYTRSDACGAAETWAKYLGGKQEDLMGVGVYGDPGLAEAVKKDALGIGFNNINYVFDNKTKKQVSGLRVLPIDLNGDRRLEEAENFYDSRDAIVEAIGNGDYPSPPARNLHFVCQGKPERKVVIEFIRWVLTEGQQFVPEAGYINLSEEKLRGELEKLDGK
ncbi:MAG: PstS family phosphate ABC transporter substrate-binding protein [Deltaproteobacteria bacterium]|nr:PstS family phosphate ABC transporter substrate-binding protein [Deltaproteobacteria bacterium]